MSMDPILTFLRSLDGVLELAPPPGSAFPEIAWGDHFFYYAPDGQVPQREQPYATIVTKSYPDDDGDDLDRPGRWRLNIHVGRTRAAEAVALTGVSPHPRYGDQGWVALVCPEAGLLAVAEGLLRDAHDAARRRWERRRP